MACGCCPPQETPPDPRNSQAGAPVSEANTGNNGPRGEDQPKPGDNAELSEIVDLDTAHVTLDEGEESGEILDIASVLCLDSCCDAVPQGAFNTCHDPLPDGLEAANTPDCDKGCCADISDVGAQSKSSSLDGSDEPACCRGKTSPCCDETCLDRLALRECEGTACLDDCKSLTKSNSYSSTTPCVGAVNGTACGKHRRSAIDRYGATLEALGCICRALLARGLESCCDTRQLSSIERKACSKKPVRSPKRTSVDSCCASGTSSSVSIERSWQDSSGTRRCGRKKSRELASATKSSSIKDACGGGCCEKQSPTVVIKQPTSSRCSGGGCCDSEKPPLPRSREIPERTSCTKGCCSANPGPVILESTKRSLATEKVKDLENQGSGAEHVVLSISGMTCTGCETKLNRTLATVAAVKNLKTSLILSRAEFDIDLSLSSIDDVMKHLERTTEFKCEKISNDGSSIDIIGDPNTFVTAAWPAGVLDVNTVDTSTVQISFDPAIVGARDLVEKGWGRPLTLAPARPDPSIEAGSKHVNHLGLMTILSAALTIPVLVMAWAPLPERKISYSSASLALATIVQVVIAGPFYPKALKALVFSQVIEMDLLIVLSTSAAYVFSVVAYGFLVSGKPLERGQFFETSTLLVTLIMVGRYVAALARQKAVESISIRSLQTPTALLVDRDSSLEQNIDVRLLQYGDVFKVAPDTQIPTDGTVLTGSSEVNESLITGESMPVEKCPGSSLVAGSINGSGTLVVRLTRLPGDNTINTVAAMVDQAKLSKPVIQGLADRIASYFVPVVVVLAIITFSIWVAVGMTIRDQSGSKATVEAITYAITVLIVSCPCAIGLAVPMVVVIASGVAAKQGVVFKSADALEVAHKTSHVVFDKTGTLTQGKLNVVDESHASHYDDESSSMLLGLIDSSRHPVSKAVSAHLRAQGVQSIAVSEARSLTGRGMEGLLLGKKLQAGNSRWLKVSSHPLVQPLLNRGLTAFCFVIDDSLVAAYALQDALRPSTQDVISKIQGSGVTVHIVSGDDDGPVRSVATDLGIPQTCVLSRCSPGDKQAYVQNLLGSHTQNGKKPVVIFCGDGTNDAVALAQATIGVHMNEGSDLAKSAADVVLMRPDLNGILDMINISKRAVNRIKFNFSWSFVYNLFAILLAAGAFVEASIPPEYAGLGELVSVLPVIAAAMLLRWSRI